jgi:hypothetical protein
MRSNWWGGGRCTLPPVFVFVEINFLPIGNYKMLKTFDNKWAIK